MADGKLSHRHFLNMRVRLWGPHGQAIKSFIAVKVVPSMQAETDQRHLVIVMIRSFAIAAFTMNFVTCH